MGFKTIAFESGVFDVWKAQQAINEGYDTKKALIKSLFTIWAKRNEFQSFIEFYKTHKKDLKLYGFDSQITGVYGEMELVDDLYLYCKSNNFDLNIDKDELSLLIESMNSSWVFDDEEISYSKYKREFSGLLSAIEKKPENESHFYWKQIIKNLLSFAEELVANEEEKFGSFWASANYNYRDQQMADNLLAYIKRHPQEKIICWGANAHFVNDMSSVSTPIIKDFIPMGSYVKKSLKNKVYSLAAFEIPDSVYIKGKAIKPQLLPSSFEAYVKNKKQPYLFISSNQPEMKTSQMHKMFSLTTFIPSRLDLLHDGYLYVDKPKYVTVIPDIDDYDEKSHRTSPVDHLVVLPKSQAHDTKEELIGAVALNEVVVYGKREVSQIVKKAIKSLDKNYPDIKLNSTMYTNISTNIDSINCLDLEFIANQYDNGYFGTARSSKQLKEVKWNIKNGYEPKNWREFYGLNGNPIRRAAFLKLRKYQKFDFSIEDIKEIKGKEVYVVSFSSRKNYFNYTRRVLLSNYTGKIYINKEDFAVVKVIERWDYLNTELEPIHGLNLKGDFEKYNTERKFISERIETDYTKIDELYFLSHSLITINGEVIDNKNDKSLPYITNIESYWSDFDIDKPVKLKFKEEKNMFKKIKYNKPFWNNYTYPNKE